MKPSTEIARLRRALREVRDNYAKHLDEHDNEIPHDPECFCARCIAVRALLPRYTSKRQK